MDSKMTPAIIEAPSYNKIKRKEVVRGIITILQYQK